MPKKPRAGQGKVSGKRSATVSLAPYEVELTKSAELVYADLYHRAVDAESKGDPTNSVCTTFRMVRDAIKNIIPSDPTNKRYALAGELSNIFRLHKGRLRICWIASSAQRKVCILFISETLRKEGDVNDPYRVFSKRLAAGEFDELFSRMGVRRPPRLSP